MTAKKPPTDMSCRPDKGGCGRTVIIVRESHEDRQAFGGFQHRTNATRQIAIHEDEINDKPGRVRTRPHPDNFRRMRSELERKCAIEHDRIIESAGVAYAETTE